jgi:hypothetical protein
VPGVTVLRRACDVTFSSHNSVSNPDPHRFVACAPCWREARLGIDGGIADCSTKIM